MAEGFQGRERHRGLKHCFLFLTLVVLCNLPRAQLQSATVLAADGLSPVGICWGRVAHAPIPAMPIVTMIEQNPIIQRVKLFNANGEVLAALANLGNTVEVMIMVRNQDLQGIAIDDSTADGWVYTNLLAILPTGVNIKYVSVGNEPYLHNVQSFDDFLMLAVNRLQAALERADLVPRIKLTVSFNSEILASSSPPSNGTFVAKWKDEIANITKLINDTGSFFSVNIYPFFTYKDNNKIDLNYIMFRQNVTAVVDGQYRYLNILDASFDALVAALGTIGFPNMEVRIGEIGWPSDGHPNATLSLAQEFNQKAIQHLMSGQGSPRRPGIRTPFYLFGLLDEDAKAIRAGAFERRWGLYDDIGNPKYNLDLSGSGNPQATLPKIPGLILMKRRWCVASRQLTDSPDSAEDVATLQTIIAEICGADPEKGSDFSDYGDCTPVTSVMTSPGLQCAAASVASPYSLGYNTSFALNAKFQAQGQDFNSCVWGGYGVVTYEDPSTGDCKFPIFPDIPAIQAYYEPRIQWSWEAFGYLVGLIILLANFL